jgi:N-acetyl-gamma-glutamyl-phosphate/LysW-gamma-L-alpha-aminoadipyl-6-phosphate reductase
MRSRALRVAAPFVHRHMAELTQELGIPEGMMTMGVTAVELVRGIQCAAHVRLNKILREADVMS